jgi:hypothetical protein
MKRDSTQIGVMYHDAMKQNKGMTCGFFEQNECQGNAIMILSDLLG